MFKIAYNNFNHILNRTNYKIIHFEVISAAENFFWVSETG